MKRKSFAVILFLMTLSLLGIIAVQWHWISEAVELGEAEFDKGVRRALGRTVDDLELSQTEDLFEREFGNDSVGFEIILEEFSDKFFPTDTTSSRNVDIQINEFTRDSTSEQAITVWATSTDDEEVVWMENPDEVEGVVVKQVYASDTSYTDTLAGDFEHRIHLLGRVMDKIFVEENIWEDPLRAKLEGVNLDSVIRENLLLEGIDTPFSSAVFDAVSDSLITQYSPHWNQDTQSAFAGTLFPRSERFKSYELLLDFPDRNGFVLQSMGWNLLASVAFIFVILLTFGTTLYYMLRQKRISQVKTDFINNMTHEFKTPLATMVLAADSIKHPDVIAHPKEVKRYSQVIKDQGEKLNEHIERVLQMARMEKGEWSLELNPLDLNKLVKRAADSMRLQAENKGGVIECACDQDLGAVLGDEYQLYNVVLNLVDNAVKYCQQKPAIRVETFHSNGAVALRISDNGIGMSAAQQKRMFDAFYRAETGNLHGVKGFGLGLSYVMEVVKLHGGKVEVKSAPNLGTQITLLIPKLS